MVILKAWIREILTIFVFLKYKSIWDLYDHLHNNNIKKGIAASAFSHYCDKKGCFIGINSNIKGHPYLPHGLYGIFISENATIGKNCVIFQHVTIGSNTTIDTKHFGSPTIGDNCYIGVGAKIIGNINVGNNVRIGANCVVTKDIPDNSIVLADGIKIIQKDNLDNRFIRSKDNQLAYWDFDSNSFKILEEKDK